MTEECAVQVPMGSTSGTLDASAFHLANNADLVAVLKALQVILRILFENLQTIRDNDEQLCDLSCTIL